MWIDNDDRIMEILDYIEKPSKECFPVTCPICGKREGHLYFHRYMQGNARGGMWTWPGVTAVLAVLGGAVVLSNSCAAPFLCKKNTAGLLLINPSCPVRRSIRQTFGESSDIPRHR